MGAAVEGWDVPPGDALRGLEMRQRTHLPLPEPRTQSFCRQCGAPKEDAKWELPQDPQTTTCASGAIIKSHYTPGIAAPAMPPFCARMVAQQCTIPKETGPCQPPAEVRICRAIPRSPSCPRRMRSSTPPHRLRLAATGRQLPTCPTSSPTARTPWASRSCTPGLHNKIPA